MSDIMTEYVLYYYTQTQHIWGVHLLRPCFYFY